MATADPKAKYGALSLGHMTMKLSLCVFHSHN